MNSIFIMAAKMATLCLAAIFAVASATNAQAPLADNLSNLLAAYPSTLDRIDGAELITKSGRRIRIDNGKGTRPHTAILDDADIKDMFAPPYPTGTSATPPALNADPGRARSTELFNAMYGDCTRDEVTAQLISIPWVPSKGGGTLKVTRINGVAEKLATISRELDQLPNHFDKYLVPSAGTYNCRDIAGTKRPSTHRWGTAIDLATPHAHYWRWTTGKPSEEGSASIAYRNSIPMEIVSIFERHGFIWGGRWYHYDTMHFEYRPELLSR
jgi:hypothetical protein